MELIEVEAAHSGCRIRPQALRLVIEILGSRNLV
jgi:hypothetical protein